MKITVKIVSFVMSIALLMSCPIYGMASSGGVEKAQRGSNSKLIKPTVTVYISPEVAAQVTDQEINQLIRGAAAKDGDTITIYDVGYASSDDKDALQGSSERFGRYNYPTSYSYGSEWEAQNYFVISVAKGQTTTLTRAFEQTIETYLKVGTPFEITAELKKSVTARYETTQKFAGPPETSAYNSREYRVQFYARTCTWTQRQVDIQTGKTVASKTGQADVPSKYLLYSLDHLMG